MSDPIALLALSRATQAMNLNSTLGIPITSPLVDGATIGSFYVRVGISIGMSDTNVAIQLPRVPSLYIVVRNNTGNVIYDGSAPNTWSPTLLTLRAKTGTTVVSLLIA